MCTGVLVDVCMRVYGPLEHVVVLGIEPEFSGRAENRECYLNASPIRTFYWPNPKAELSFLQATLQQNFSKFILTNLYLIRVL